MDKDVLTLNEASEYLGVSRSYLYKLTSGRAIKHYKPTGKKIYFKKEDLDDFLTSNEITSIDEVRQESDRVVNRANNRQK